MSILLSGRVKFTVSVLAAAFVFMFGPASVQAKTCNIIPRSFECLSPSSKKVSLAEKAGLKKRFAGKSYRVAAARSKTRLSDAGNMARVVKPVRNKARSRVRSKRAKRRVSRRSKMGRVRTLRRKSRAARSVRTARRSLRRKKSLRTIGSRYNPRSLRKQIRAERRLKKRAGRKNGKKGWRTRSRRLGYVTVSRSVTTSCFPARLKRLLRKVSRHYGRKLRITSGYRSHRHNRRIGGARRSQHIHCTAADFYVPGVNKYALARYLKSLPGRGGVGTYSGNRIVHLDVGPRRSWHWGGRKKRRYARKRSTKRYSKARKRVSRQRVARRHVARFRGSKS